MSRKSKKLRINAPIISTYPEYGHLFSIIDLDDTSLGWVVSNFIHIITHDYPDEDFTFFKGHYTILKDCPFLKLYSYPIDIFTKDLTIAQLIIDAINNDYFVVLMLNYYYVSTKPWYKDRDRDHIVLIYGYNIEKSFFYALDNCEDGKYGFLIIPFGDVQMAYENIDYLRKKDDQDIKLIKGFRKEKYAFSIQYLKKDLELFLDPTHLNYQDNSLANDNLLFNLDSMVRKDRWHINNGHIDLKTFCIYIDHALIMEIRVNYLLTNSYMNNHDILYDVLKLKDALKIILNKAIKYNISMQRATALSIYSDLENAKSNYKLIVQKILKSLY